MSFSNSTYITHLNSKSNLNSTSTSNSKPTPKSKSASKSKSKLYKRHFNYELCDNKMDFHDCELAILRHAVDEGDKQRGVKMAQDPDITSILSIVEEFLKTKGLICYGGTAINNVLPKSAQFYDRALEIPDYDFYSPTAMDHAKELADVYHKAGFKNIEAKAGMHYGTYKVFVNYIPIADITYLDPAIYKEIGKEALLIGGIKYAPPDFLRMNMYLELSRPAGDVSRWEKVLKRLTLLNKHYPLKTNANCNTVDFQRKVESSKIDAEKVYYMVRDVFVEQEVIFIGGYAVKLYARYMKKNERNLIQHIPDFDVLSEDPELCATIISERLNQHGFTNIQITKRQKIGELIPERLEIKIDNETIAFIYKPIACHNYNSIYINKKKINVGTIETLMSFYIAFYYSNEPYYFKDRILCMARFLFDVEQKNRLAQRGLLKRFSIKCYGVQDTLESIRADKMKKYRELKNNRKSREYDLWFLKYTFEDNDDNGINKRKTKNRRIHKNRTRRIKPPTSNEFLF